MLKSLNMIELLLLLLKEDGNVFRNIFKIISYSTALFTLHFTRVLIKMLFTISICCFIYFYKESTSNYLVLMVFRLF